MSALLERVREVSPEELRAALLLGEEIAVVDAREEGEFGRSHLFWAVPVPLSKREWRSRALLPRKATPVVCVDGGEGYAAKLAEYLTSAGYTDVAVLKGGTPGWVAAGFVAFSGVHVPSKAFGEWVEHHYGTESLDPPELDALVRSGVKHVILDSRPMDEFRKMSIPGGVCVPGGELAYRIRDLVPDADTTIVVNCAGRTRSIMGAESLRQAGVPNRVVALRNGTMGWELAGFKAARGESATYPAGTPRTAGEALAAARAFADKHGVRAVSRAEAERLLADGSRTTYALDVRAAEEYAAGHIPGFRHAPGGQLVQATDQWVAVRGARILLSDDDGVRARMAGGWLRQMGQWEVLVVEGLRDGPLEAGPWRPDSPEAAAVSVESVTPEELAALLTAGQAKVVELSRSIDFRDGHIPGAVWGVRGRLGNLGSGAWVVAGPDEATARLAAAEIGGRVLAGGTLAWRKAGLPLASGRTDPPDEACVDWYLRPYDRNSGIEEAMREYLSWEIDLVHEVARDGTSRFG
jgi:rhodanese-related sulfurtransferase